MASSAEPPPKKRKLVEAQTPSPSSTPPPPPPLSPGPPPTPPPPQTLDTAAPSSPPPPSQWTSPSPEEVLRKRRNREELRNLFECYRRIRLCVERKDARLMPELEQVYLALITASRVCHLPSQRQVVPAARGRRQGLSLRLAGVRQVTWGQTVRGRGPKLHTQIES